MRHIKRNAKAAGGLNNGGSRSSILVRSGVSLSFYFPHKMFVAAHIKFVGVLVGCKKLIRVELSLTMHTFIPVYN